MPTLQAVGLNRLFRMAVVAGVESAVKIHIQRGDDPNARDGSGLTPLMLAAMRNKAGVCALLLSSGADPSLVDPDGTDALAHAYKSGSKAAFTVIQAAINLVLPAESQGQASNEEPDSAVDFFTEPLTGPNSAWAPASPPIVAMLNDFGDHSFTHDSIFSGLSEIAPTIDIDSQQTANELSNWEPEVDPPHGSDDPIVVAGAATVQIGISNHTPFDTSVDWDDLEAYLPLTSAPLRRANDVEAEARMRLLLLRAVREGSVPDMAVVDAVSNVDCSENEASEALLRMVINDLGAETDERLEHSDGDGLYEAITSSEESPEEEDLISDAMAFIDAHESNRNASLQLYQREFQREKLITAEEEVAIAKDMERAITKAIDVLATWPQGIDHVIACFELVKSGEKPIQWFSGGAHDDEMSQIDSAEAFVGIPEMNEPDDDLTTDHKEQPTEVDSVDLFVRLGLLAKLATEPQSTEININGVRSALISLSLKSSFLLGMLDFSHKDRSAQANLFALAMNDYQQARDQMAIANLKLVASIAKKFYYTGMPMEDLIQDGNIGLLKAVEKYDWRKGFRFSTYATWWIRQSISRSVAETSRTIRLPVHIFEIVQKLLRASSAFELANGRTPSKDEVAAILSLTVKKVATIMRITQDTVPIDAETIDELIEPSSVSDFSTPDPFDLMTAKDLPRVMDVVLAELDQKQEGIIRLRFGLGVSDDLTLEEIGIKYGVTRERIRQIESKGMRVLKQRHRVEKLKNMLYGNWPLVPVAREIEAETGDGDFDLEIGDSTPSSTIIASNRSTEVRSEMPLKKPIRRQSTFHRLMTQALEMGVDVTMDRESTSGTTWVNVKETPDNRHRKLIRKLLAIGFKHWPGKGYWK